MTVFLDATSIPFNPDHVTVVYNISISISSSILTMWHRDLLYMTIAYVTWKLVLSMSPSSINLASPLSFIREGLELQKISGYYELDGVRRIIGYITMLAKSAIYV